MDLIYGINLSQDRVLSSVIFTQFQLFYFPGYNAIILRSGNIEMVFWATVASVYHSGDPHNRDPITCMIHAALNDDKDMNLEDSIVVKTKLNISSPEEYSGSSDLEVYETFVTRILWWLKMNGLLSTKHTTFQVEGTWDLDSKVMPLSGIQEMSKDMTDQLKLGL